MNRLLAVTAEDVTRYWESEVAPWSLAAVGPGMPDLGAAGLLDRLGG